MENEMKMKMMEQGVNKRSGNPNHTMPGIPCPVHPSPVPQALINSQYIPPNLEKVLKQLEAQVRRGYESFPFPNSALSLGLVYDQELIWSSAYGTVRGQHPVTLDTPFRVGSVSKLITVVALLKARDAGKVQLDDPISKYVPGFGVKSPYKNNPGLTWRSLAGQVSGLGGGTPCDFFSLLEPILNDQCDITNEEAWKRIREEPVIAPMYAEPHYADSAYAILGRALEYVVGKKYEQYLEEEVFGPLGMTETFFDLTWERSSKVPDGYVANISFPSFVSHVDLNWARPTGQIYSTVRDLSKLASLFLVGKDEVPNKLGIYSSTLRQAMEPSFINDDASTGYGYPFEMSYTGMTSPSTKSLYWVRTKAGAMPGYMTVVSLVPELKLGILMQMNNLVLSELEANITAFIIPAFEQVLSELAAPPPNPGNLTLFEGVYVATKMLDLVDSTAVITADHTTNQLIINATFGGLISGGASAPLGITPATWYHDNVFRLAGPPNTPCMFLEMGNTDVFVFFQTNPSNPQEVVSLTMPLSDPYYGWKFYNQKSSWWLNKRREMEASRQRNAAPLV